MVKNKNIKNIVLIMVDALRARNLGCYGYLVNTSPNIDKFAESFIVFNNAYACCANTDPAFTSIADRLYPCYRTSFYLV
ncbi:sulfatase-like hydrolase/transferase [bacterium]|nr:sulfatase-like hydrolase/transferase [bacterium]